MMTCNFHVYRKAFYGWLLRVRLFFYNRFFAQPALLSLPPRANLLTCFGRLFTFSGTAPAHFVVVVYLSRPGHCLLFSFVSI